MERKEEMLSASGQEWRSVRVIISGTVQGVGFRYWTMRNAEDLGLDGWVLNRYDGKVEALFAGRADSVGQMLERCREGPRHAEVTGFEIVCEGGETEPGFEIRRAL